MAKTGYCNGSDLLLYLGGKAVGSCTSHTATFSSETKERAVKPVASAALSSGKWKKKGVVGLSWKAGEPVEVKCMEREGAEKPYLTGNCVITSLEETAPAQDDATYSVNLENDGEPTKLDEEAITENVAG